MSSVFSSPKRQKVQQVQETEPMATVTEDATEAGRKKKKHLATAGTQTRMSGIRSAVMSALKKRLGE